MKTSSPQLPVSQAKESARRFNRQMTPNVRKHNTSILVPKLLLWDLDRFMKSVIVLLIIHLLSSAFCVQSNVTGSTGDSVADSQYTAVYHPPQEVYN